MARFYKSINGAQPNMSLARSSNFGISVNFEKSHDSYLFDDNTGREFLDFFGMYASLPLGYNHSIFKTKEFIDEYLKQL